MERTLDLNADVTLDMMKVYVEAPEGYARAQGAAEEAARDPPEAGRPRAGAESACAAASATTGSAWTSCTARS